MNSPANQAEPHDPAASAQRAPRSESTPRRRGPLGKAFSALSILIAIPLTLAASTLLLGDADWRIDLVANLSAQALLATTLFTAIVLIARRRKLAALGLSLCAIHLAVLMSHRAAWWPLPSRPPASAAAESGTLVVRLMHHNTSTKASPDDILALVSRADADVVSLTEPPWTLWFSMKDGRRIAEGFGPEIWRDAFQYSTNQSIGPGCLAARWAIDRYDASWVGELHRDLVVGIITVPNGSPQAPAGARFAVIGAHPRSPRTAERWRQGNEVVRALAGVVKRLRADGLPVIVMADLNSTPSGWRSRHLCAHADLRRAKPLLQFQGTYPAGGLGGASDLPWPASIAIDDAFVSPDIDVLSWRRADQIGSDHFAVYTSVRIHLHPPGARAQTPAKEPPKTRP